MTDDMDDTHENESFEMVLRTLQFIALIINVQSICIGLE